MSNFEVDDKIYVNVGMTPISKDPIIRNKINFEFCKKSQIIFSIYSLLVVTLILILAFNYHEQIPIFKSLNPLIVHNYHILVYASAFALLSLTLSAIEYLEYKNIISLYAIICCIVIFLIFRKLHLAIFTFSLLFILPFLQTFSKNKNKCSWVNIEGGYIYDTKLNYSFDNLGNNFPQPLDLTKCKLCKSSIKQIPHSTYKDLVVTVAVGNTKKAMPYMRSLRTVGCQATVLVITNTIELPSEFKDCGFINIPILNMPSFTVPEIQEIRFHFLRDFLKLYGNRFERVFYFDTYDSFFQLDPFIETKVNDTLYVSGERWNYEDSFWAFVELRTLPKFNERRYLHGKELKCSGAFLGSSEVIYKLSLLHSMVIRNNYKLIALDQMIYDWLIETGVLKNVGIYTQVNKYLQSIRLEINKYEPNKPGLIKHKNDSFIPAILHQINTNPSLEKLFLDECDI